MTSPLLIQILRTRLFFTMEDRSRCRRPTSPTTIKLILLTLAVYEDRPISIKTIADLTQCDRATVLRALSYLRHHQLVTHHSPHPRRPSSYTINRSLLDPIINRGTLEETVVSSSPSHPQESQQ